MSIIIFNSFAKICFYISSILIFFIPTQKFWCAFRLNWLREILFANFFIFIFSIIKSVIFWNFSYFFYIFFIVTLVSVEGHFILTRLPFCIDCNVMSRHFCSIFMFVFYVKCWVFIPTHKYFIRIIWMCGDSFFITKSKIACISLVFVWIWC